MIVVAIIKDGIVWLSLNIRVSSTQYQSRNEPDRDSLAPKGYRPEIGESRKTNIRAATSPERSAEDTGQTDDQHCNGSATVLKRPFQGAWDRAAESAEPVMLRHRRKGPRSASLRFKRGDSPSVGENVAKCFPVLDFEDISDPHRACATRLQPPQPRAVISVSKRYRRVSTGNLPETIFFVIVKGLVAARGHVATRVIGVRFASGTDDRVDLGRMILIVGDVMFAVRQHIADCVVSELASYPLACERGQPM